MKINPFKRFAPAFRIFSGHFLLALLIAGCTCFAVACSSSDTEDDPDPNASITFMTSPEYTIEGDGGSVSVRFTATGNWNVEIPEGIDWITVDPMSGSGSASRQSVSIQAAENEGDIRKVDITITCGASSGAVKITQDEAVVISDLPEDMDRIYIPYEFRNMDLTKSSSTWYWGRSRQSEHFIVFWAKDYGASGATTPSDLSPSHSMYVDIDDLLAKAEQFYDVNVNTLKFIDPSSGNSCVNKYKMMILLYYQDEWLATGSGYDNTIGALWVNPSTCKPVGSTIAHEIGHCFQYMVYCDYLLAGGQDDGKSGWRYGYGPNGEGGNGFWEQCAQWQSFQTYKSEAFANYYFPEYIASTHLHTLHEDPRYSNYFIQWWWTEKYGIDFLGKLWRESKYPEDPNETYMRLNGMSVAEFNDDIWQYAAHMVTWDTDEIREYGKNYVGSHSWDYTTTDEGYYRVSVARCPETTGYNAIRLNAPEEAAAVSVDFRGLPTAAGYNCGSAAIAGWRYGFVAYMNDGSTRYSEVFSQPQASVSWDVPAGCDRLWLVVTGAPSEYEQHLWDDNNTNDAKWPYEVKFSGTDLYGNISFDGSEVPANVDFTFDVPFAYSAADYSGATVSLDIVKLARAFVEQPSDIKSLLSSGKIKFVGLNANGNQYTGGYTANGYGHWFDASGNVCVWGENARVFSEFDESSWSFSLGQYPGRCEGQTFTIRQALVYGSVKATFTFNITVQ